MADYTIDIYANDRTGGALGGISNSLGRLEQNSSRVAGALRLATGAAVAFATGSLASSVMDQYTQYERLNTQLATYLGSQEAATAEMARLKELANALPQDLADISEAFVILQRTGQDTSSATITALSNIATANNKDFAQLAEATADALTGEFERLKEFGVKVSKENDQFVVDMGNGNTKIVNSAAEVVAAVTAMGEEGGRFADAAANNAGTASQAFSNLKGAVFESSIAFGDAAKGGIIELTTAITDFIRDNQDLIASIGQLIGEGLAALPGMFSTVVDAVKPLQPVVELLGTVITDLLWPALVKIFEVLGQVATAVTPLIETMLPPLRDLFEWIATAVGNMVQAMIPVYETVGPAIVEIFNWVTESAQAVYDGIMKIIDSMVSVYNKAVEIKNGVTGVFGDMKDGVTSWADDTWNSVTAGATSMWDELVGHSIIPDMVDAIISEFQRMGRDVTTISNETFTGVTNEANRMQDGFLDTLINAFDDGKLELNDFKGYFLQGLNSMVSQALSSLGGLGGGLGGLFGGGGGLFSGGGLFGGIGSLFSGLFGGFFADGGYLPSGQYGIAGENGPELITGPANITPMNKMAGDTVPVVVNFNINAMDTSGATEVILKQRKTIEGIIQNAYNKQGKVGIY